MTVKILFFGATADAAGTRTSELDVQENATMSQVIDRVTADFPSVAKHKLLFSRNEEYANGEEIVKPGDEIAIFTAVSGG